MKLMSMEDLLEAEEEFMDLLGYVDLDQGHKLNALHHQKELISTAVATHAIKKEMEEIRVKAIEECAKLAAQWGDARVPSRGGDALKNFSIHLTELSKKNQLP